MQEPQAAINIPEIIRVWFRSEAKHRISHELSALNHFQGLVPGLKRSIEDEIFAICYAPTVAAAHQNIRAKPVDWMQGLFQRHNVHLEEHLRTQINRVIAYLTNIAPRLFTEMQDVRSRLILELKKMSRANLISDIFKPIVHNLYETCSALPGLRDRYCVTHYIVSGAVGLLLRDPNWVPNPYRANELSIKLRGTHIEGDQTNLLVLLRAIQEKYWHITQIFCNRNRNEDVLRLIGYIEEKTERNKYSHFDERTRIYKRENRGRYSLLHFLRDLPLVDTGLWDQQDYRFLQRPFENWCKNLR